MMRSGAGFVALFVALACSSPAPTAPAPSQQANPSPETGNASFRGTGIAFEHPAGWRETTFDVIPSSNFSWIVFLSTEILGDPCQREGNGFSCSSYPLSELSPSGVLINWAHWGFAGWELNPGAKEQASVGGRRATVERRQATGACAQVGGEMELVVQIENPDAVFNWDEMNGCIRGPNVDRIEGEIDAMLASVRWITSNQDPRPLPTGLR